MRSYGSATAAVIATRGVPLPAEPAKIGRRAELVECGCGHRGRPGAFHICIDLSTPEPKPAPIERPKQKAKTTPKVQPRPAPASSTPKPKPAPKPKPERTPRPPVPKPLCVSGCGSEVAHPGNRCRPCYDDSRTPAPKVLVGRGAGGGIGNKGGTVVARLDEVIRRYQEGESTKSLAADLDVTQSAIVQTLKRNGIKPRSAAEEHRGPKLARRALTPEQELLVVDDYKATGNAAAVARKHGIGETTARNILRRRGVANPPAVGSKGKP